MNTVNNPCYVYALHRPTLNVRVAVVGVSRGALSFFTVSKPSGCLPQVEVGHLEDWEFYSADWINPLDPFQGGVPVERFSL